jgi:hypothetical protein
MKFVTRIALYTILFLSVLAFWIFSRSEFYCYLWPTIDTQFAIQYSEKAFQKIEPGMTKDDVRKLLGEPIDKVIKKNGMEMWSYSQDGDSRLYDFAWLGRMVEFDNGIVNNTISRIYND